MKTLLCFSICSVVALVIQGQPKNLDFFLERAVTGSPLLKDYKNQIAMNALDSQRIRASYGPLVTGNSTNSYAPVIAGYGYDGAITNGGQASALVGVSQAIISKKHLSAQYEALRIQSQTLQNTAQVSEQDLKRTITAAYITTYGDFQQLQFAREVSALLRKEESFLKRLTESNVYRQTDYLTFLVTLQQQELVIKQLQIQFRNDYANLNYLSGIVDTAEANLSAPNIRLNSFPGRDQSIFFRKFILDSIQFRNSSALVEFGYKPKLNLSADAGYNSTLTYLPYKNFGTSFGFTLTVPIYDGRQKQIQLNKIAVQENTRTLYRDFFSAQYDQQVQQLIQQLNATNELVMDIEKQVKYSEGLINVNLKLLETGDVRIADLVIAINNYLTAKNLLVQNNTSRLQIITQINYWNR